MTTTTIREYGVRVVGSDTRVVGFPTLEAAKDAAAVSPNYRKVVTREVPDWEDYKEAFPTTEGSVITAVTKYYGTVKLMRVQEPKDRSDHHWAGFIDRGVTSLGDAGIEEFTVDYLAPSE